MNPAGEVVYYGATLAETDSVPMPKMGTFYRVAPPTAPAEVLAAAPELLLPNRFLDDSQLVVGYAFDEQNWGLAVVNMRGEMQVIEAYPNAMLVGVLR